jgi:Flp pilus assembly pilin Flp
VQQVYRAFVRFLADEGAHSPIEYSSILAMIVLTINVSVTSLGSLISNPFWTTSNTLAAQNTQIASRASTVQGPGGGAVQGSGS